MWLEYVHNLFLKSIYVWCIPGLFQFHPCVRGWEHVYESSINGVKEIQGKFLEISLR